MSRDTPSVSAAVTAAGRLLRDRPGAVLPAYLLASAVATVARVPLIVGAAGALAVLDATGRVGPIVRAVGSIQESDTPPTELSNALDALASPGVLGLLGVGVLATVLVAAVVRPIAVAVAQSTVWAAIDGADRPLARGVAGATRWRTFLGLFFLRAVAALVFVGLPVAAAAALAEINSILSAVAGLVAVAGGVLVLSLSAALAFAGPAAVIDGVGAVDAIRGSIGFIRRNVGTAVAFLVVAAGLFLAASVISAAASALGVGRVGGLVGPFVVAPVFDLAATGLYAGVRTAPPENADHLDRTPPAESATDAGADRSHDSRPAGPVVRPATDRSGAATRLKRAATDGLRAFAGVVPAHPFLVTAAAASFLLGGLAGWRLTAPYGVRIDPPGSVEAVFGTVPIDAFANIAANNWIVAVGGIYGGLGFGLPAAAAAATNGLLVGALAGVFDPLAFTAFVAPHGVIEVPTLVVAWGLGLHLGAVGWRAVRGRATPARVARELRRAARVLVGIAVLLVVAAAIEAFVTPQVARLVL